MCREVVHDPDSPGASYSLRGLVVSLRPPDDLGHPLVVEDLVLFAQVYGQPGDHTASVRLVRADHGDTPVVECGPWPWHVFGNQFVEAAWWPLRNVPFPEPGVYEFRLMVDGMPEPLAATGYPWRSGSRDKSDPPAEPMQTFEVHPTAHLTDEQKRWPVVPLDRMMAGSGAGRTTPAADPALVAAVREGLQRLTDEQGGTLATLVVAGAAADGEAVVTDSRSELSPAALAEAKLVRLLPAAAIPVSRLHAHRNARRPVAK